MVCFLHHTTTPAIPGCTRMNARPLNPRFICRPAASAALIALALSACASLTRDAGEQVRPETVSARQDYVLSGLPGGLEGKALARLPAVQSSPSSLLEKINNARQASRVIEDLLASEGWLTASVNAGEMTDVTGPTRLEIMPGERFVLSQIRIEGLATADEQTAARLRQMANGLQPGQPVRAADIENMEAALVGLLQEEGYAFASSPGIDALASRQTRDVELTYTLIPGPRVRLGGLVHDFPSRRSARAADILRPWQSGDLYSPAQTDQLTARLSATRLYDAVGVELARAPDEDGLYPVHLSLTRADRRTIRVGATASTTDGIGGDASWQRRDLTGRADTLTLSASAATLSRSLDADYEIPNAGRFGRLAGLSAGIRGEETNAYDLSGARLGARLVQPLSSRLTASLGTALDLTRTTDRRARILSEPRDQVTASIPLSLAYSNVSNLLDPERGMRAIASTETGLSLGDKTAGYTRLLVNAATYQHLSDKLILALRGEYGAFLGSGNVPADRLFFAGGGGSVRGYEYQTLSPRTIDGEISGGRSLFTTSAELRWRRSERLGYAAFIDAGAAGEQAGSAFDEVRASIGLGLRYYPGFGPVRLDIGIPLSPGKDGAPAQIYLSIGQAF